MLSKVVSYGADSAELFFQSEKGVSLEIVNGSMKSAESNSSSGYGLRIVKNKRIGFSYFEHENGHGLKKTTETALSLSQLSKQSQFSFVSGSKLKFPKIRTVDKVLSGASENDAKEWASSVAEQMKRHSKTYRVIVSFSNSETRIENTEGLNAAYPSTGISIYAEIMKGKSFGFSHYSGRFIPDSFDDIGTNAADMMESMRNPKKPATGKYTVVLSIFALKSILGILLQSFSGDWKRKGIGLLSDKAGKKMFQDGFFMSDSPLSDGSSSFPFDDEGIPAHETRLVENGVVSSFLYDRATAALEEVSVACGSCSRSSFSSRPVSGYSNLFIRPGSYRNFEGELHDFILVESLHGAHTANALTGDFSLEVPVAFHFRGGKPSPVRGFLLSGNIFKLFNSILGIEKEVGIYDNLISPRIAFSEVNIV